MYTLVFAYLSPFPCGLGSVCHSHVLTALFTAPAVRVPFGLGRFVPLPCTAWGFPHASPWPITYWHYTCFVACLLRLDYALPPMWSGFLVSRSFSCFVDGSIRWSPVSWAVSLVSGMVLFSRSGLRVPDPVTWFAVRFVWGAGLSALPCAAVAGLCSCCGAIAASCFLLSGSPCSAGDA